MAYRRKTYKKRFMKSKRKRTFKRKSYRSKSAGLGTSRYTGNINVECNLTLKMEQHDGNGGVKLGVAWGSSSDALTGYDYNQCCDVFQTKEWKLYFGTYMEYKIVGMKVEYIPGGFIGDGTDSRVVRQMHIGTSQEEIANDADLTVSRLQMAQDYNAYPVNATTRKLKRYYKPAMFNKRVLQAVWNLTSDLNYCKVYTYMFWEIDHISPNAVTTCVGDWNVKWYVQFRKPKFMKVS